MPAPEPVEPEPDETVDLAPAFNPEAALGIGLPPPLAEAEPPDLIPPQPASPEASAPPRERPDDLVASEPEDAPAVAPRPETGDAGAAPATSAGAAGGSAAAAASRDDFAAAIRAAISRALYYPPVAVRRNLTGTTELSVRVSRDGKLISVRVTASSGSEVLDRAAIGAASLARLPAAPASLPDPVLSITVPLVYTQSGPRPAGN